MSLYDEYQSSERVWSTDYIEGLIRRIDKSLIPNTDEYAFEEGDGWYGLKCSAYDKGNPEMILDAIQLEQAVDSIQDRAVKAATILCMYGWDEQDIGSVIRDRAHRPGHRLVDDGIRMIRRHEVRKREEH